MSTPPVDASAALRRLESLQRTANQLQAAVKERPALEERRGRLSSELEAAQRENEEVWCRRLSASIEERRKAVLLWLAVVGFVVLCGGWVAYVGLETERAPAVPEPPARPSRTLHFPSGPSMVPPTIEA